MKRFTPLYGIAYAIMKSMENLRFGKEDYFHVLVFYTGYFIKDIQYVSKVSTPLVIFIKKAVFFTSTTKLIVNA